MKIKSRISEQLITARELLNNLEIKLRNLKIHNHETINVGTWDITYWPGSNHFTITNTEYKGGGFRRAPYYSFQNMLSLTPIALMKEFNFS